MEKFKFNFSKPKDQEIFNDLSSDEKLNIKNKAHDEASMIRALAIDLLNDSSYKGEPTTIDYSHADSYIKLAKDENNQEKLDRICEVVARQHEFNLVHWKKPMAVRVAYSGFLNNTIENGFKENSFIYDRTLNYFNFSDIINWTRNDAFDRGCSEAMCNAFDGNLDGTPTPVEYFLKKEDGKRYSDKKEAITAYKSIIRQEYPEAYEIFCQKEEQLRFELDELEKNNDFGNEWSNKLESYQNIFIDIESITEILNQNVEISPDLNKAIIINLLKGTSPDSWNFQEIDNFYTSFVNHYGKNVVKNFYGGQLYDMAYIVDYAKINKSGSGYLPGNESLITAEPDCIEGLVINGAPLRLGNYFVEKAKIIFRKNPELSRPLYDTLGNMIWPDNKTKAELDKEFPQKS